MKLNTPSVDGWVGMEPKKKKTAIHPHKTGTLVTSISGTTTQDHPLGNIEPDIKLPSRKGFYFAEDLRSFLGDVSVVGARFIGIPGVGFFRRIVWVTFILVGLGFMTYQVYERIRYFSSKPVTVDVRVIHNRTLRFPTVTICNENRLSKQRVAVMGSDVIQLIQSMNPAVKFGAPAEGPNFSAFNFTGMDWTAFYSSNAQPKDEAITFAYWDGQDLTEADFRSLETNMGQCFQFNGDGDHYVSSQAGATYGLKAVLFLNQSDYLVTNEGSLAAGFRVALHGPDEEPLMKEWGFRVTPGFQTLVAVTMKQVTDYGPPYVECEKNESYIQSRCLAQCEADFVVDRCQCKLVGMPSSAPVCDPRQAYECMIPIMNLYLSGDYLGKCTCPRQCASVTFKPSLSSAIISEHVIDFMGKTLFNSPEQAERLILKDYTMLEIFFSQLSYEEVATRPAYTILALFCDIGGATGLILGSSILTLFEVIDFVIVALWRGCVMRSDRS